MRSFFLPSTTSLHGLDLEWLIGSQCPLRSSLKKQKSKDLASLTSETSSKRVRYGLGAEQTSVWLWRNFVGEFVGGIFCLLCASWVLGTLFVGAHGPILKLSTTHWLSTLFQQHQSLNFPPLSCYTWNNILLHLPFYCKHCHLQVDKSLGVIVWNGIQVFEWHCEINQI